jgi:hypothetical protein
VNVQFLCEVTDQQRQEAVAKLERTYGNARCDVHGEQLRIVVSKIDSHGRCSYHRDPCCDEFHLTLCLERDREFELHLWNECYPYDTSRDRT